MNDFTTTTINGHDVQTNDGDCWKCESNEATTPVSVQVGPMSLKAGFCDECGENPDLT